MKPFLNTAETGSSEAKEEEAPEVIAEPGNQPSADIHRYRFPVMAAPNQPPAPGNRASFSSLRTIIRRTRQRDRFREQQEGFTTGYQEGYQAGLAEGRQAGHDLASQQQAEISEKWLVLITSLWQELQNLHTTTLEQLGQPLMALVTRVAQQVLDQELAISHRSLQRLIEQSLEMLPDTDSLIIMINPEDRPLLEPMAENFPDSWTIQEDDSLTPGGCRLVAGQGEVDGTVEGRLNACLEPVRGLQMTDDR